MPVETETQGVTVEHAEVGGELAGIVTLWGSRTRVTFETLTHQCPGVDASAPGDAEARHAALRDLNQGCDLAVGETEGAQAQAPEAHPRVRQSGSEPARHGRLSKEGSAAARHVLAEAAWMAARSPGPLRAFAARVAAGRGRQVAAVAVARKLCVLCWCLPTRTEDYAFARPAMVRRKLRRLELAAGAPRRRSGPQPDPVWNRDSNAAERRLAEQAERADERLVADRVASRANVGAGATPGRAW